ncbi:hypothetical protein [Streptomyces sp. NPDC055085]
MRDAIDSGQRPGTATEESAQIKAMKKEIAELKRANDILKARRRSQSVGATATASLSAGESTTGVVQIDDTSQVADLQVAAQAFDMCGEQLVGVG